MAHATQTSAPVEQEAPAVGSAQSRRTSRPDLPCAHALPFRTMDHRAQARFFALSHKNTLRSLSVAVLKGLAVFLSNLVANDQLPH